MARKAGLRIVLNQNGVGYPAWLGSGWQEFNRPMAYIHHVADHVFYQSEFCRLSAERHLGRRNGPGEVLFNAVDTGVFTPCQQRIRDNATPVVLVSGSHHGRYLVEGAIESLRIVRKHIPGARLIVAGRYCWLKNETAAPAEVKALARERGLGAAIEWRGAYTQAEAPALLQEADILLHSKYNDCCPRLVLEAMSCGLPVVYSGSGGMPELVGTGAGIGIPAPLDWEHEHAPDPESLANAICTVTADLPRFSSAARRRAVEQFDITPWLRRHSEVFHKLTQKMPGIT